LRLIGSPFAWNHFRDPFDILCIGRTSGLREISQTLYTMDDSNGRFLQGEIETNTPITQNISMGFWGRGEWLSFDGNGNIYATIVPGTGVQTIPHTDIFGGIAGSGSTDNAQLDQSYWALGLTVDLAF
jgi:hypothetical protein